MNKTVLITGASCGIGKACAIAFDEIGYNIIVHYNTSKKQALDLVSTLSNAIAVKADITDIKQVDLLIKESLLAYKTIDVLINNAGISQQKMFNDISINDWDNMFNTNVRSMFLICKGVLPNMINSKTGKIINISSMWGISGASCEVHYSASKSAIIGFTKALAKELAPSNINVNCIAPGVILTKMNNNLTSKDLEILKNETPLNRLGIPEDVANMAVFLASKESSFVTGQVISVDGGMVI